MLGCHRNVEAKHKSFSKWSASAKLALFHNAYRFSGLNQRQNLGAAITQIAQVTAAKALWDREKTRSVTMAKLRMQKSRTIHCFMGCVSLLALLLMQAQSRNDIGSA